MEKFYCLFSDWFHFILDDVTAGLGPLKEDVSRIGFDDDDKQAKGICPFDFLKCHHFPFIYENLCYHHRRQIECGVALSVRIPHHSQLVDTFAPLACAAFSENSSVGKCHFQFILLSKEKKKNIR